MITRDMILTFARATPYRPFSIHLSDGREVKAAHPDSMFVSRGGTLFHESDDGEITIFDLDHITSINLKPRRRAA